MFLKKVTLKQQGKTYNYYKIVASYRDKDGKPKHRLIQNLGALSDEDAAKMKMIIQSQQGPDLLVAKHSDLVVTRHWLFLPVILLHSLWEMLQLHRFFPDALLVEAMVLNRCLEPQSKIHMVDWMKETTLPALYNPIVLPEPFAVYRELDQLNKQEINLQTHLYQQLERIDPSIGEGFFYDITSSYMEGSHCVIAKLGYSRDHRPDLQQIVIALMVTPEGSPFYWKVLEGNTQDVTTLPGVVKDLKQRFGLKSCHLVFDRGMVSMDHLEFLETEKLTYLSAMDHDEMVNHPLFNAFMPTPASKDDYEQHLALQGFQPTDEQQFFYTREGQVDQRRFIFSFDVSRFYEDIASRERRITKTLAWISEKNAALALAKNSRNKEALEREAKQLISRRKLKGLFQVDVVPLEIERPMKKADSTRTVHSFEYVVTMDKEKEADMRRSDGITCFITNEVNLSSVQVIQKYREKNKIEEAFREMKTLLALRPIHLTRPERVKAHVSLCILAYLLLNTMEMQLRSAGESTSPVDVLRQLQSCQLNQIGLRDSSQTTITMTEMSEKQKHWMEIFACEQYLKPKVLKQITESLKQSL
jgi:transposase